MSRAPTIATQGTSTQGRTQKDIKPSDVYELKLKTQQTVLKARQLRTQLNRLNDRIVSQTNAINKTREQQSESLAVTTNHANSVPQLKRSVESAENALAALRNQIKKTRQDDKTFIVKELEEEVKLAYCENQRLMALLNDSKSEASKSEQKLQEASRLASNQNVQRMELEIRDLQNTNASLRDKAVAYNSKKMKLDIDKKIKEDQEKNVTSRQMIEEATKQQEEANEKAQKQAEELEKEKEEFLQKMDELQKILDEQRQKISDCLSGKKPEEAE